MEFSSRKSKPKKVLALTVIIVLVLVIAYLAATYPRVSAAFSVSFTVGADVRRLEFEVPFLHNRVRVEVLVRNGNALWNAKILSGSESLWSHASSQSGQTTYISEWIKTPAGHYNFTFATVGIGSLEAEIKLTSKGGLW